MIGYYSPLFVVNKNIEYDIQRIIENRYYFLRIVTTRQHTPDPFYNGAVEIQEQYMRMFQFDYKRACCSKYDFDFEKLN